MSDIKEYSEEIQELFLRFLISDSTLFSRCQNIVEPAWFSRKFQPAVELLKNHSTEYNSIPTLDQINSIEVSGKSGRKSTKIATRPRKIDDCDEDLIKSCKESKFYNLYCEINSYESNPRSNNFNL